MKKTNARAAGIDRRELLQGASALGAYAWIERANDGAADGSSRDLPILVVLQLTGGNDGLSMVVPHGDDLYARGRPTIAHPAAELRRVDDYRGLHPALEFVHRSLGEGKVALVEGCGYPQPIRSHFKSFDVWHTADPTGRAVGEGWIGRLLASAVTETERVPELVVHVGREVPYSLHSAVVPPIAFRTASSYRWVGDEESERLVACEEGEEGADDERKQGREALLERLAGVLRDAHDSSERVRAAVAAYRPRADYPRGEFFAALETVAALVEADVGMRVASLELRGFDTHGNQKGVHDALMRTLDRGLAAFFDDLEAHGNRRRVVLLAFSEFGRRVKENASRGTDHGTAGPMIVIADDVRGGLHGKHPSLADLDDGDLRYTTDFRSVYASVAERCFGTGAAAAFGCSAPPLRLF